jgi:pimeloyl-[acyl-carrier protein] synthase
MNMPVATCNLLSAEAIANPYPLYRQLREEDPIHWDDSLNAWFLTRYADVTRCLRDKRFSSVRKVSNRADLPAEVQAALQPLDRNLALWMLFLDPPDHTRLRTLANKAFSPRVVHDLVVRIEALVDRLLSSLPREGVIDLIEVLAYPLPAMVIGDMLGVPPEDIGLLKRWSDEFALFFASGRATPERALKANEAVVALTEYLSRILTQKRIVPQADLISQLLLAEDAGIVLSDEELLANATLLLFAGHETTTNLIGNAVLALLLNPDQLDHLRADSSLAVPAVEEFLRYDGSVQFVSRICQEEIEMDGRRVHPGQKVMLCLGGANRDPAGFRNPDQLDLSRRDNHHVSFGAGGHFCLGAPLARAEIRAAITGLLRRYPEIRLPEQPFMWKPTPGFRGLTTVQLEVAAV